MVDLGLGFRVWGCRLDVFKALKLASGSAAIWGVGCSCFAGSLVTTG